MASLLPLFPLQLVVFPRTQLPLHIFEDRYKEMVGESIRDHSEFGIVLAKEDGIVNAGCTVLVEKVVTEYPDGRMDILIEGRRRFEILYLNQEKSYLRGGVDFFEDEDGEPVPGELKDRAVEGFRALRETEDAGTLTEPRMTDEQLSFQLAQSISDLDFQSRLLRSRSEVERLKQITEFWGEYIPRVKYSSRMRRLAPRNGFGHKSAGV
jgi:Lon protease-like protein